MTSLREPGMRPSQFVRALANLSELAVFVALGLTVSLGAIIDSDLWWQGLVLAALLAFVARPLVVAPLLLPADLTWGERGFIAWSGLKGAVPILLASLAVVGGTTDSDKIYGIVFVVVLFSVVVQGTGLPFVASALRVPMTRQPVATTLDRRQRPRLLGVEAIRVHLTDN